MKLGHVAISVGSIKRSAAFYKKHFGMRLAAIYKHKDAGLTIAMLKRGDITLELFECRKHKALPAYRRTLDSDLRTIGVKHFSLEVADIAAWHAKLKKSRVHLATDLRSFDNGKRYFFLEDPDGNLMELMES